jgi:lipopolysaccharide export system ATP-binding protein
MKSLLEFDSIELEFGFQKILSSVAMRCMTGEVVGLLGRNGSGKSCMMKIVFGYTNSDFKSVRIDKQAVPHKRLNKMIGYLPQENLIPSYLKISEAIAAFKIEQQRILEIIPFVKDSLNLKPNQCSGGSLRMVETLLILLSEKAFCILDEPFSGIMPIHIEMLKEVIQNERRKKGIIISDHLYRHVKSVSDRMYMLANGQTYPIQSDDQLVKYGYLNEV